MSSFLLSIRLINKRDRTTNNLEYEYTKFKIVIMISNRIKGILEKIVPALALLIEYS
jgi:hypothetical protein